MNQPSRKKTKGVEANVMDVKPKPTINYMDFWTTDPTESIRIILEEFSSGTMNTEHFPRRKIRFTGRSALIKELAPAIYLISGASPVGTAKNIVQTLRTWWQFFDSTSEDFDVQSLDDIDELTGFLQHREGINANAKSMFLNWVNAARQTRGLPKMFWTSSESPKHMKSLPKFSHVKAIYHYLKHNMTAVTTRWDVATSLANSGIDWSRNIKARHPRTYSYWTSAETHATYRGATKAEKVPYLSRDDFGAFLGTPNAVAVIEMREAVEGLYPTRGDVQYMFFLFILLTGWNASTALALDAANCIFAHPSSPEHHVVRSIKGRANSIQTAVGLTRSVRSPGGILRTLMNQNAPLREEAKKELKKAKATLKTNGGDRELLREIQHLERKIRSPWLFVQMKGEHSAILDQNYLQVHKSRNHGLVDIIKTLNRSRASDDQISLTITLTSLRDAYIAFAYESSGYSWLVAKFAAGHKSIKSLRSYLERRQYKAHSEMKVAEFGDKLWHEIKIHKKIDPAVLHARMQRGEITEDERAILTNRTRVGTGCEDFLSPPKEIAPEHKKGQGCRIQRCTLCRHAIYFSDSCDHLARRQVELEEIRQTISILSWNESTFQDELDAVEFVLSKFKVERKVKELLSFWRDEVCAGRHKVPQQEGAY